MNLKKYINRSKSNGKKIWLHKLPNDETLFDVIDNLRKQYNILRYTFVINQNIRITGITIDRDVDFSNCIFQKDVNFSGCIFSEKVNFLYCVFNDILIFERTEFKKGIFVKNGTFSERVSFIESNLNNLHNEYPKGVVNFHNIIFKKSILCSQTSFEKISFDNVQFKKGKIGTSEFVLCSFFYVTFSNTFFEGSTLFESSVAIENISFKNTIFKGNTHFRNNIFKGNKTNFLDCKFDSLTNISDEQILFSGSTFESKTDFTGSNFNIKTNFSLFDNHVFEKDESCHFKDKVDFKGCIFTKETDFSETIFEGDTNFSEAVFGKEGDSLSYEVSFNDAKFDKIVRFHSCNFYSNTKFENTSFNKLVDFYLSVFHKEQQFLRTDFLDITIFSGVIFEKQVQFLYNKVNSNSYINFESSVFKEYLDISRANFNCNLNFWNVKIEDKIRYINTYTKYEDDFGKYNSGNKIIKPIIYTKIRESFRIMKDYSYKQNNKIEGLKFYEKEMSIYERENKKRWDKILLWANKISNNFGTNWIAGVKFSLFVGILSYLAVLVAMNDDIELDTSYRGISNFITSLVDVFNLTKWVNLEIIGIRLKGFPYLLLFIGRIFIGYGYYQTIQAFRKFGKS